MKNSKILRKPKKRRTKEKGRKPVEWSDKEYKVLENLCKIQATVKEIESVLELDYKTINRLCEAYYEDENGNPMGFGQVQQIFSAHGKISIRRAQFQFMETTPSMAIFLGKQYLGQRDNPVDENSSTGDITFKFVRASEVVNRDEQYE